MKKKASSTFPTRNQIRIVILKALQSTVDGKAVPSVVYTALEDVYPQRTKKLMSDLQYATRFTRKALVTEGLISAANRGVWALTAKGFAAPTTL